jgi:hypothetical protein
MTKLLVVLPTTVTLALLTLSTAASAGTIRLECTSIKQTDPISVKSIAIIVTFKGPKDKIDFMSVIWNMKDGTRLDRLAQYHRKKDFDSENSWNWSGTHQTKKATTDGMLEWVTKDIETDKPIKGHWQYTEEYWPDPSSRAGREITWATGCTGTDGNVIPGLHGSLELENNILLAGRKTKCTKPLKDDSGYVYGCAKRG